MLQSDGAGAMFSNRRALADTVVQSELVIGEGAFVTLFPRREGYGLWMIDTTPEICGDAGDGARSPSRRLRRGCHGAHAAGWYTTAWRTRIFDVIKDGALGLLVGTLGIAAVLARTVSGAASSRCCARSASRRGICERWWRRRVCCSSASGLLLGLIRPCWLSYLLCWNEKWRGPLPIGGAAADCRDNHGPAIFHCGRPHGHRLESCFGPESE